MGIWCGCSLSSPRWHCKCSMLSLYAACLQITLTFIPTRLSLIILVIVTEITERPFATSIFSRRSFIKGTDKAEDGSDTLELSISQQGDRPGDRRSQIETQTEEVKKMSSDRTTVNSPESPEITGSPDNSYWGASPQQQTQRQSMLRDDERQTRDTLRYDGSRRQETDRMYPPQPRQNNMRYNRPRSQFFPEPLESVYSPDAFSPDVEGSPLQNRSLFSWRPPTRESMHSQPRNSFSRRPDEASTVSTTRISTVEPASQPPSMPLPPMPLRETPEELAMPPSRAFAQERPFTAPESAASPVFPSEVRAEAPPSIAQLLSALSTRAAARRRNSLVVRQAELAPVTESIDMGPADSTLNSNMTSILFPRPEEEEPVEQEIRPPPTRRATTARDLLSENGEPLALRSHPFRPSNATSGAIFMAYQDPYEPEEFKGPKRAAAQRPTTAPRDMKSENDYPPAPSEHSLQRSVLNFSRPRLPGMGSEYDDDAETVNGGARSIVGELRARPTATGLRNRTVRRSRSLPTLVERPWSSPDDDDDDTPQERPWAPRDHTPRRPAPREDGSQFGDSSNLTSGETHTPTTETGVRADVRTTTTIAPSARAPRFSPFPRVPGGPTSTSNADAEQKMRAQVSSSVRRRNERIARWREEVQADDSPTYQA